VLESVIAKMVDPKPAVRNLMLSAILMGGNVLVKGSLFRRVGNLAVGPKPAKGDQVLCTNPANLAGGSGILNPIQPSAPFAPGSTIALGLGVLKWNVPMPSTVFWTSPGASTARCEKSNGAHVLMVTARNGAQTPTPAPTPEWGLHLLDAYLSLGNLLGIVTAETQAFAKRH
jgi:hypothetical protein